MSEIKIRQTIPDAWAQHGRCPFCAASGMRVQHPAAGADQLQCMACGLTFEVELDGARLHISHWPDSLPFMHIMVSDTWMTAAELRALIQRMAAPPSVPASISPAAPDQSSFPITPVKSDTDLGMPDAAVVTTWTPTPPQASAPPALDPTGIAIRIKKLRALGNSPKEIQTILTQSEKEPERAQAILRIIAQMEHQEQSRQWKKLRLSLGIVGGLGIILLGAGFVFLKNYQNKPVGAGPAGQNTPAQDTPVPNPVVKALNLNTPVVNYNAGPPSSSTGDASVCPRTSQQAADLFGGQPGDWVSPPSSNGWIMVRKGKSADIFVPKGMKAAYLQLGNSLQLVDLDGPATLSGVYYIAVSCP